MSRDVEGLLNQHYITFGAKRCFRILPFNIICSDERTAQLEETSEVGGTVMSKDKYPSIFSCQMKATVFINLQLFFATHAVLKIGAISSYVPQF